METQSRFRIMTLFEEDEQCLICRPNLMKEELLETNAMFYLSEITSILNVSITTILGIKEKISRQGESPYSVMGVVKLFENYQVRMKVFAPFYREYIEVLSSRLPEGADVNEVLRQTGTYKLSEVIRYLPFSAYQIRQDMRGCPHPEAEMGVFRHRYFNFYFVRMPVFAKWLEKMWVQR